MIHRACILSFLAATLLTSAGADNRGGSGYSRYGIGDIVPPVNLRSLGMGGAGLSLSGTADIDLTNPAGLSRMTRTLFTIDGAYEGFSATDARTSAYLSRTSFGGASLALPVATGSGVVFALGVVPLSRVNYNIILPDTTAGAASTLTYLGEGGISRAFFALSASPDTHLHVGMRLNYHFGTINQTIRQTFPSTDYTSAEVVRSARHGGIGLTFGTVYDGLGKLLSLGEKQSLSIGAVVSTNSWLTTNNERLYSFNTGNLITKDTATLPDGTVKIPLAWAVGLDYQSEQWTVAADYAHQNWSALSINGAPAANVRDGDRFSAGGEFVPTRDPLAPFTQRWAYRFGLFYDASYYAIGGTGVNEFGLTAGFGIPITAQTKLNLAASYSFRGSTDNGMQQDRILRLSFGVTVGELWFVRHEEE